MAFGIWTSSGFASIVGMPPSASIVLSNRLEGAGFDPEQSRLLADLLEDAKEAGPEEGKPLPEPGITRNDLLNVELRLENKMDKINYEAEAAFEAHRADVRTGLAILGAAIDRLEAKSIVWMLGCALGIGSIAFTIARFVVP